MEAVRPEGETAVVSVMLPVNPPRLLRVMLEVADWVARILRLDEPVDMAKSTTLTANVTERVIEPPVAVELIVRVEVPVPSLVRLTLTGLVAAVKPEGDTIVDRVTTPVKL